MTVDVALYSFGVMIWAKWLIRDDATDVEHIQDTDNKTALLFWLVSA